MSQSKPIIALLPWGDVIEDFLDPIGVSLETFCNEMTGSWMFGYIEALQKVNIETVLFCISKRVATVEYQIHQPTGAQICLLPAPKIHGWVRRPMRNPYGWTFHDMFESKADESSVYLSLLRNSVSYLATPLRLLGRELKRFQCQAILCQEYEYPRFDVCVALGKWLNIPVFATFQGGDFQLSLWEHRFRPWALQASRGLIIATQTEIQRVQREYGVAAEKIAQIFNPLNLSQWEPLERHIARKNLGIALETKIIVYHGRIDIHRKGLDILLQAWQRLFQDYGDKNLQLLLVGSGGDAKDLGQMMDAMKVSGVIWVNQYINNKAMIREYLSASDIYVLPSRHEGFPVAPLEAMACGLPVVATDAPGVPDIFAEGEVSGGIVVSRENVDAFTDGLKRLLDDISFRQMLGLNARRRVETHFSLDAIGHQLKNVLLS